MIIANLKGGLGNQMFQYAAGKCLAKLRGTGLKLDDHFLKADPNGAYTKRHFELHVFNAHIALATTQELPPFYKVAHNRYARNVQKFIPFLYSHRYYDEKQLGFDQQFQSLPSETYIDGYFQSEQYFLPVADLIRQDFTFKGPVPAICETWLRKINACNSVSLHIRRGDYVSNPADTTYHGTCSESYYRDAVSEILKEHSGIELFIFSDDLAWCEQNLDFKIPAHFVDTTQAASHWDMFLMSQCRHNIIANSSYSWWGAWLNSNASKTVIAPKKWFGDATKINHDIIPAAWKTL